MNENGQKNKRALLKVFLKAYWWAILIVLFAPVLLNFIILIPAFSPVVGKDTDWLSFHGSYIGSVIASLITLYVLYKQLQHNHEENERTRRDNQAINEKNRQLQLNILKYEQQRQWLLESKTSLINNVHAYNHNDVREVCHAIMFHHEKEDISSKIKALIDRIDQCDMAVRLLISIDDKNSQDFNSIRRQSYDEYIHIIKDIQQLTWFVNQGYLTISVALMSMPYPDTLREEIQKKIIVPNISDPKAVNIKLSEIALGRADETLRIYKSIWDATFKYIHQQNIDIEQILTE